MELQDLAALFDVDTDSSNSANNSGGEGSSDYSEKAKDVTTLQSFEDKVQDLQVVLGFEPGKEVIPEPVKEPTLKPVKEVPKEPIKQPVPVDENEIIKNALEAALIPKQTVLEPDVSYEDNEKEEDFIPEEDVEAQVDADIAKAAAAQNKVPDDRPPWEEPKVEPVRVEPVHYAEKTLKLEPVEETVVEEAPAVQPKTTQPKLVQPNIQPSADNPLNLKGVELLMFKEIQSKYPYFNVSTDSVSWREFYVYKIRTVYDMLSRFSFLDTKDIRTEMGNMKLDHYVGNDTCSVDLLRRRLDDSVRWRTRLSSVLFGVIAQYYAWDRALDMLRGKAYGGRNIRGVDKRDNLCGDHLQEIEFYVKELEGIVKGGQHLDSILKACGDSLSRQIACIQLREATGFTSKDNKEDTKSVVEEDIRRSLGNPDDFDTLEIDKKAEVSIGAVNKLNFGVDVQDDEISGLGIE